MVDWRVNLWYICFVIIANLENTIFDYESEKNSIILPITNFVRKDGNLAVVSEVSKMFFEKYPQLSKKWGYMVSNNVPYPSYSTKNTNLIGIPNKNHYASALNHEMFNEGLWYIKEESLVKNEIIFYLIQEDFMNIDSIKEIFNESNNVVLLREKGEEDGK